MTPDKFTNSEKFIDVGDGHELYVQDWGNPNAKNPIVFLHGGPGSGLKDRYKDSFDPKKHRIIFHDQRGCGKSTPYGSLENNTTDKLVEDISKIADALKIKQFILHGYSWGSTLALAYALKYPKRIKAMVIGGIFTGSQAEADWLNKGGMKAFYPDVWDNFVDTVPDDNKKDPAAYHIKMVMGRNEAKAIESGYAYQTLEGSVMSLDDRTTPTSFEEFDVSGIRIEMHYINNLCFMPDRHILDNAHRLTMPIWIVHGRYDMVCPPKTAYELNQKLPKSKLIWTTSGHKTERESWNIIKTILDLIEP